MSVKQKIAVTTIYTELSILIERKMYGTPMLDEYLDTPVMVDGNCTGIKAWLKVNVDNCTQNLENVLRTYRALNKGENHV